MDATHIYCASCRAIRPVEFERLLASEASLGTAARCVRCGWLALAPRPTDGLAGLVRAATRRIRHAGPVLA
ncbi:MAG: hypothetical protein E6H57_08295 [Betaproteobacteria bacterium]|nr:MAG: hypothetical protein E6H57_08295 [Betaproteobacteria bacterium]